MSETQITATLDSLNDDQLVIAVATGKRLLETRFAAQQKEQEDRHKRMLQAAITSKKRGPKNVKKTDIN